MNRFLYFLVFLILTILFNHPLQAKLSLSKIYSNHMVIQRNQPIVVWGWADNNAAIKILFNNNEYSTNAGSNGNWKIVLPQMKEGGPLEMTISTSTEKIVLKDILIGDVWVCSGQSNMEMVVNSSNNAEQELKMATDNKIRHFKVPNSSAEKPEDDLAGGEWVVNSPQTVGDFTAAGYFFARELRKSVDVPIGLLNTSWGGSRIEAWMSSEVLDMVEQQKVVDGITRKAEEEYQKQLVRFKAIFPDATTTDKGFLDNNALWADPNLNESDWKNISVPILWEDAGYAGLDGIAWYRTTFNLTSDDASKGAELGLGKIDDSDIAWINGIKVGGLYQAYNTPRIYKVDPQVLKEGKNVLSVRVEDTGGGGGIYGDASLLYLKIGEKNILPQNDWKFKIDAVKKTELGINHTPSLLFNKMIYPILNFPIKGALWYQGESNTDDEEDATKYRELFASMIKDWRTLWGVGDFPFIFVQLANYKQFIDQPSESLWAILRESQSEALKLPNTAQAVIIDIGDANDIHPRNKQDVGLRLSLAARKIAYGENIVYSGPTYKNHKIKKNKIVVSFTNTGSGLIIKDKNSYVKEFAIAGADKKFYWAKAEIENESIIVWSEKVKNPKYVRYAWADNPADANLYNAEELPASPFRTNAADSVKK